MKTKENKTMNKQELTHFLNTLIEKHEDRNYTPVKKQEKKQLKLRALELPKS